MSHPESSRLLDVLRQTARALDERGLAWALVGGLAVSVRAEPRFTRDIDVAIAAPDDAEAEQVVAAFQALGFVVRLVLEQQALGRMATVRLVAPGHGVSGVVVDLLFASAGIEAEVCCAAERLEIVPGLVVPVARAGHLIAMKVLAVSAERWQDEGDLRVLITGLAPAERARALAAVSAIEAIGANRGKPLREDLERRLR